MRAFAIASLLLISRLAVADPTAQDAMAEAEALVKAGDFVGAASKFKLAHARDPRPELICNVGVAYYKAKQLARAQLFLNRCLERGTALEATFVDSVRTVLKSVEASLRSGDFTPVDIVVDPAAATVITEAFGADEAFIGSRVVWLPSGAQKLTARAEGYIEETTEIDARGRDLKPVKITLKRKPSEPSPPGTGSATPPIGTGSAAIVTPLAEPTPVKHATPSKVPALIATSVSLASLAVAIVGYQRAHDRAALAGLAVTQEAFDVDASSVSTWNTVMVTTAVISVASAGIAGYLWSRALRTPNVELQTTGNAIAISGRW